MKNKFLVLLLIFIALSYSLKAQICNSDPTVIPMYDIYTPMGTPVLTWLTEEDTPAARYERDSTYIAQYPFAEPIPIYNDGYYSTSRFNCHGYAWIRTEGGPDRWLSCDLRVDRLEQYKYMEDSSYIRVNSETHPGKVSWSRMGDHSAVTTDEPGVVISKWGNGPLMKHDVHYSPCPIPMGLGLEYYVKNCSLVLENKAITTDTPITSCGDITVQNVTVTNGAKLTLDAAGEVNIISDFEVELGSEFEIK